MVDLLHKNGVALLRKERIGKGYAAKLHFLCESPKFENYLTKNESEDSLIAASVICSGQRLTRAKLFNLEGRTPYLGSVGHCKVGINLQRLADGVYIIIFEKSSRQRRILYIRK